jgi:hypothetical protein
VEELVKILPLINEILPSINLLILLVGGGWAIYQYFQQQKFKRLQNLSAIWNKFTTIKELMDIFGLCDNIVTGDVSKVKELTNFSSNDKLKFLALLEEVALYAEQSEVDNDYAKYLFQWHFKFVFTEEITKNAFWENIGGVGEIKENYWEKSRIFAQRLKN